MARIIECDRCSKRLKAETEIYHIDFIPHTTGVKVSYELCQPCFDEIQANTKRAPEMGENYEARTGNSFVSRTTTDFAAREVPGVGVDPNALGEGRTTQVDAGRKDFPAS